MLVSVSSADDEDSDEVVVAVFEDKLVVVLGLVDTNSVTVEVFGVCKRGMGGCSIVAVE